MTGSSTQQWPFIPTCLTDILDKDTLTVIESGSCERLGRPLTIMDFDAQTGGFTHRIESVNEKQRYEDFCRVFREESHVSGGDKACKKWDIGQTRQSLLEFQQTGKPYRLFPCHMGLLDMTYIIQIRGKPVALIFSGQFRPQDAGSVESALSDLNDGKRPEITIELQEREHLSDLANRLTTLPDDAHRRLETEAAHIQRIAEAQFERNKRQQEQDFLEQLRGIANMLRSIHLDQLRDKITQALRLIREFCHCEYALFFTGMKEDDTVLVPFAQAGLPSTVGSHLPHFNWSKAKLPLQNFNIDDQYFGADDQKAMNHGIRGDHREHFARVSCIIPTTMGDRFRSVLVLGPFAGAVDIRLERHFLTEIARIIGIFARTNFEVLHLEQERRRWENTAMLLTHEYKTHLTTITTPIGRARNILKKSTIRDADRADEFLKQAEDQSLLLGRITSGTLEGIVITVEPEDLEVETCSLSALVENCVAGFVELARKRNLELVLDPSVSGLPLVELDIPRFNIALANLIENAIKYSFSKSKIFVRSHLNISHGMDQALAVIEVDNIGFDIREEDRKRIFEVGERGGDTSRIKRIPGSGYGLWEARSIIEAHRGEIHVKFHPTTIHKHEGRANRVIFSIEIPLRHKR